MSVTDTRTVGSIIGGEDRSGDERIESRNPANLDDLVCEAALGDAGAFVDACRAARAAQREWAAVPAPVRGNVVKQIGRIVEDNKEALSRLVTREIGKPYPEALGEVQEIIDTCDFFLSEGRRLYGQTVPSEMPDKQLFTFRMPVGVAAIITAGNFPVAVPSWYLVPAILCGNAVVWKPAEYAPALGDALARLFIAGGLPDGVFNLVQCDGPTAFDGLTQALDEGLVDKVGFTGSSAVGSRIGELTGRHGQSACLELGGKNPLVVMPDADLDLAVEGTLFSGFGTAGQRCTSLGTAIVHESIHDEFVTRLTARGGGGADRRPHPGGALRADDPRALRRAVRGLARADPRPPQRCRARPAPAGSRATTRARASWAIPTPGSSATRRSSTASRPRTRSTRPRRSARSSASPRFSDFDEAMELANGHGYGLSSAVYTNDPKSAFRFRERVTAGMVSVNNSTSGAEAHLPFGGNGKSGNGSRQSGIWVLEQFTRWQSMNWDYAGKLQKAQMEVAEILGDTGYRLAWD